MQGKCFMNLFFIFTEDLDRDSEAKQEVLENLSKLKELEQKELLSQCKYFQDISSMTGNLQSYS